MNRLTWTKELWEGTYREPFEGKFRTYSPEWCERNRNMYKDRADFLATGITLGDARVAVVGCGLGWLNYYLEEWTGIPVDGYDDSPYLLEHPEWAKVPIVAATVGVDSIGERYDLVVDEDAISTCLDDAAAEQFIRGCDALADRVVHITSPTADHHPFMPFPKKTVEGWAQYAPHHQWISSRDLQWP